MPGANDSQTVRLEKRNSMVLSPGATGWRTTGCSGEEGVGGLEEESLIA